TLPFFASSRYASLLLILWTRAYSETLLPDTPHRLHRYWSVTVLRLKWYFPGPWSPQKGQLASTSSRRSVRVSRTIPHRLAASTMGILEYARAKRCPPFCRDQGLRGPLYLRPTHGLDRQRRAAYALCHDDLPGGPDTGQFFHRLHVVDKHGTIARC